LAQRRKKGGNRRNKSGGGRPLAALLITVIFLVLGFVALEMLKKAPSEKPATSPKEEVRQKMPPRLVTPPAAQKGYSSGVVAPAPRPAKRAKQVGPGTVAIIVDDMGNSVEEVRALLDINLPMTFSIIPGLPKAKAVAETAHGRGREVMLHIPMEPKGYESKPFEKSGLLLAQSDDEIVRRLDAYFRAVPYVVGANNHMGSRFTEDRAKMRTVLGVLKGKGVFFIDSKTTPASVGEKLAREMGIETASRSVFLDNTQDVAAIRKQLDQAAAAARKRGSAIAICHPHRATIQALTAAMPELQKEGITFVAASELVR
jgi:polysaccharide deacetylase 2 family uncharacterized protein YibQ